MPLTLGARRHEVRSDTFYVATGARTSRYDTRATTPAAAILFKATENVSLYANYIEGLSKGQTAPVTAANAGELFAPYKTKQKEAGIKVDFGDFTHTLSVFRDHAAEQLHQSRHQRVFASAANSATGAWNGASSANRCAACA